MVLVAGCTSASQLPTTPAFLPQGRSLAESFAHTSAPVPVSQCEASTACQTECDGGVINACTRLADKRYSTEPSEAETLWIDACFRRDGRACARLMHITAEDTKLSDAYGWHACQYADVAACELLGTARLVRALSPRSGEDSDDLFEQAATAFQRACNLDSWYGCASAVVAHRQASGDNESKEAQIEGQHAYGMASLACDDRDLDACRYLADWAREAGDDAKSEEFLVKACAAALENALPEKRADVADDPVCADLTERGLAIPTAESSAATSAPFVGHSTVDALFADGHRHIFPPRGVQSAMSREGMRELVATVSMCISDLGNVENLRFTETSPAPSWNREIIEGMRGWRYTGACTLPRP